MEKIKISNKLLRVLKTKKFQGIQKTRHLGVLTHHEEFKTGDPARCLTTVASQEKDDPRAALRAPRVQV